jgi:periplasmic copper chaperone A
VRRRHVTATRLIGALSFGSLGAVLLGAHAALAHVDPVPGEVQAGETVTVEFGIEHGCGEADTTGLLFQIPAGVTDVVAVDRAGWTTAVDAGIVSFSGVLDHDTPGTFALTFTTPDTPGPIDFPAVQQCGDTELRWIEIQQEGEEEPENPAPRVNVVGEVPAETATTTSGAETSTSAAAETTAAEPAETTGAPEAATTLAPAEATTSAELVIAPAPETSVDVTASEDDGGGSGAGVAILIAVIAVAAAGGGYLLWARSRRDMTDVT